LILHHLSELIFNNTNLMAKNQGCFVIFVVKIQGCWCVVMVKNQGCMNDVNAK